MNKKTIATIASLALIIFLTIATCYTLPLEESIRMGIFIALIPILAICVYFWQLEEFSGTKFWVFTFTLGIIWTVIGLLIVSDIYQVDIISLINLDPQSWQKLGYIGIWGVGPLVVIVSLASILRSSILSAILDKKFTNKST